MSNESDPASLRQLGLQSYFWSPPPMPKAVSPFWIGLLIGLLLLTFVLSESLGPIVGSLAGLITLPIFGFLTLSLIEPALAEQLARFLLAPKLRPSDEEIDRWTHQSLERAVARSRTVLQIEEQEILAYPVTNYAAIPASGVSNQWMERTGLDGQVRAPSLKLRIFWITQRRIAMFEGVLDLVEDRIYEERSREFSPSEISSVSLDAAETQGPSRPPDPANRSVALLVTFRGGQTARVRIRPESLVSGATTESALLLLLRSALHRTDHQSRPHAAQP